MPELNVMGLGIKTMPHEAIATVYVTVIPK
jgi:hypothetical protein